MPKKIEVKKWEIYGRLTIIEESIQKWNVRYFECKCNCDNKTTVAIDHLRRWNIKSCWCLNRELLKKRFTTHWKSTTRIYKIWTNINKRCNNSTNPAYHNYWWRGIRCEWNKFEEFYEDMIDWYSDNLSIDRKDNDWNYTKENCRWSTDKEQARNRRTNTMHKWKCLIEWCETLNINYRTVLGRIKRGLSIEEALNLI